MSNSRIFLKRSGPDWTVWYIDLEANEPRSLTVFGSPTIDDALKEAKFTLKDMNTGWYRITRIELISQDGNESD